MSDVVRRIAVPLTLVALAAGTACSSNAEQATPTYSTTTSSTVGASTAASKSTATPSTPAAGPSVRTTIPGPQTDWPGPSLRPDGTVPIAAFNAFVDTSQATWTQSPLRWGNTVCCALRLIRSIVFSKSNASAVPTCNFNLCYGRQMTSFFP